MRFVDIGSAILILPDFLHEFGTNNHSLLPTDHVYSRSFSRHLAVERVLLRLRELLEQIGDACPTYMILDNFLGILLGLNCNFPPRDVALYTVWQLGFYQPFIGHGQRCSLLAIPKNLIDKQKMEKLCKEIPFSKRFAKLASPFTNKQSKN